VRTVDELDESLIRIPDVCKATGVNYGSVYHHFGSREGVIDAAYNVLFSKLAEEDIHLLREVSDSATTLDEYMGRWPHLSNASPRDRTA